MPWVCFCTTPAPPSAGVGVRVVPALLFVRCFFLKVRKTIIIRTLQPQYLVSVYTGPLYIGFLAFVFYRDAIICGNLRRVSLLLLCYVLLWLSHVPAVMPIENT